MTTGTRESRRQELIGWIDGQCFITAMLPSGRSRPQLEDRTREWVIRVNRHWLGTDWYKPRFKNNRLSGVVFFEQGQGGWHAHMILNPPTGALLDEFLATVPLIFWCPPELRNEWRGKSVAIGGKMFAQKIEANTSGLRRVAGYASKELQYRDEGEQWNWKFVEQLAACRGCR